MILFSFYAFPFIYFKVSVFSVQLFVLSQSVLGFTAILTYQFIFVVVTRLIMKSAGLCSTEIYFGTFFPLSMFVDVFGVSKEKMERELFFFIYMEINKTI